MNIHLPVLRNASATDRTQKVIGALSSEKAWTITIEEYKPKRSDQQNRYLWGVCYAELCKVLEGWHAEDVHDYMLGEHFGWETIEGMGRKRMRPLRRSSKLNKQEFADFVAFIQQKAAEHGVFIPDPDGDLS
jgi:hypothetical protein